MPYPLAPSMTLAPLYMQACRFNHTPCRSPVFLWLQCEVSVPLRHDPSKGSSTPAPPPGGSTSDYINVLPKKVRQARRAPTAAKRLPEGMPMVTPPLPGAAAAEAEGSEGRVSQAREGEQEKGVEGQRGWQGAVEGRGWGRRQQKEKCGKKRKCKADSGGPGVEGALEGELAGAEQAKAGGDASGKEACTRFLRLR